jgi:hypothetical protein
MNEEDTCLSTRSTSGRMDAYKCIDGNTFREIKLRPIIALQTINCCIEKLWTIEFKIKYLHEKFALL